MDGDVAKRTLGETGIAGLVALVVALGYALVGHGLMDSFLRSMGMEYEDLF